MRAWLLPDLPTLREENGNRRLSPALRGWRADLICVSNGHLFESRFTEPSGDVRALEREPPVMLFRAQPLMTVRICVGNHKPPTGFEWARHFADGPRRIGCMVKDHIGKHGVHFAGGQWQGIEISGARLERLVVKPLARLRKHTGRRVNTDHTRASRQSCLG